MDHSTFKFTAKNPKENVFHLLFEHNFIKKSSLIYIRNMRPKQFVSDKYHYRKQYFDDYNNKLKTKEKQFIIFVRGLGDKTHSVKVINDHTMNEVKAYLHKIEKVPKQDLLSIIFAGEKLDNDFRMRRFEDKSTLQTTMLHPISGRNH